VCVRVAAGGPAAATAALMPRQIVAVVCVCLCVCACVCVRLAASGTPTAAATTALVPAAESSTWCLCAFVVCVCVCVCECVCVHVCVHKFVTGYESNFQLVSSLFSRMCGCEVKSSKFVTHCALILVLNRGQKSPCLTPNTHVIGVNVDY